MLFMAVCSLEGMVRLLSVPTIISDFYPFYLDSVRLQAVVLCTLKFNTMRLMNLFLYLQ